MVLLVVEKVNRKRMQAAILTLVIVREEMSAKVISYSMAILLKRSLKLK